LNLIVCKNCGANDLFEKNGYSVCKYCGSVFVMTQNDLPNKRASVALVEDVRSLLQKCMTDPKNARKYANLVLDMDPGNAEALKFL
jgi:hypothetical protein